MKQIPAASPRLGTLQDLIQRLDPGIRMTGENVHRAAEVIRHINPNFDIPCRHLAACMLLVWDDQRDLPLGSRLAFAICARNPDIPVFDRIAVLHHLTDRNRRLPDDEWQQKLYRARAAGRLEPVAPARGMAAQCADALLTLLLDPDVPHETLEKQDRLHSLLLCARLVEGHQARISAVEAMAQLVREDYWPEQITRLHKVNAMQTAASIAPGDTKLGGAVRHLLYRLARMDTAAGKLVSNVSASTVVSLFGVKPAAVKSSLLGLEGP